MEQVKINRRTFSTLITMDEIKKRLKKHYLQLKMEHSWSDDEMALNIKSSSNQSRNIRKATEESSLDEGATIVENLGTRRLIVGTCRIKERRVKIIKERCRKINQMLDVSNVKSLVIMQMNAGMRKTQVAILNMSLFQ